MRLLHAFAGLIVCWLAVCQPQVEAQFAPFGQPGFGGQPGFRQGSASRANTNAYERQVDLGNNVELTQGISNSRAVTRQNGQRVVSDSQARTRDVDLGGLQIGNTLTRTRTNANGAVSGGLADQFRIGNVGLGASLSPDNLRQGLGLQRGPNGDLRLGLGLLSFDLDGNVQNSNSLSQAQVNAQGKGARVASNSNSRTNSQQIGGVNVKETYSNSNAFGRTRYGQTSANAAGFGENAATFGGFRRRRAPQPAYRPQQLQYAAGGRRLVRPKRRAQYVPFGYNNFGYDNGFGGFGGFGGFDGAERPRRQFGRPGGFGGFGGGGGGGFGGFGGGYGGGDFGGFGGNGGDGGFGQPNPYENQRDKKRGNVQSSGNAGAQGGPGFNQQAASNNFANQNADGSQNSGSSSISSNLAKDGSSGQVSSANTNHQSGHGQSSDGAQSQALNFRPGEQQASSANANTKHTKMGNRESIDSTSGSTSSNNNKFGSSTNTANTNTDVTRDGNQETINSGANSQSIFQGANNQGNAAANTAANISSERGPNGSVTNSATSSASATSQNGQSANADASAIAGGNGNGANAGANANGGGGGGKNNRGGANANSNVFGGFNGGFGFGVRYRTQQKVHLQRWRPRPVNTTAIEDNIEFLYINRSSRVEDLQPVVNTSVDVFGEFDASQRQGRTFSVISDWFSSLFGGSCVSPCTLEAFQSNRCCETYVIGPPPPPPPPPQPCCLVPGPVQPVLPRPPLPQPLPAPQPARYPLAYPPVPLPGKNTPVMVIATPLDCCTVCTYTYYGPPPCGRFNNYDYNNNNSNNNNRRVTIYVPPPYYG